MNKRYDVVILTAGDTQVSEEGQLYMPMHDKDTLYPLRLSSKPNSPTSMRKECVRQHLYLTSDEEIVKGDYMYNPMDNNIIQWDGDLTMTKNPVEYGYGKVVATTDQSLPFQWRDHRNDLHSYHFPQIPADFLRAYVDAYNKGNPIANVLVQVEKVLNTTIESIDSYIFKFVPKLNSSNEVIIKETKVCYTREEVIELFKSFNFDMGELTSNELHNWIDRNL